MAMFYVVTVFVLAPLFWQRPEGFVGWMQYLSSAVFQASALPVLAFVSKKGDDFQGSLLKETHDRVMEEFNMIKEELDMAKEEQEILKALVQELHQKLEKSLE